LVFLDAQAATQLGSRSLTERSTSWAGTTRRTHRIQPSKQPLHQLLRLLVQHHSICSLRNVRDWNGWAQPSICRRAGSRPKAGPPEPCTRGSLGHAPPAHCGADPPAAHHLRQVEDPLAATRSGPRLGGCTGSSCYVYVVRNARERTRAHRPGPGAAHAYIYI
jgi:hypothetical protein